MSEKKVTITHLVNKYLANSGLNEIASSDSSLEETGFTSLMFVGLVVDLEEAFQIEFEDTMLVDNSLDSIRSIKLAIDSLM